MIQHKHPRSFRSSLALRERVRVTAAAACAMTLAGALSVLILIDVRVAAAQTLDQIVAEAKKEGEATLIASASTFGGKKGFAELEAGFNKRYGLNHKINLVGGPSFPQVA